MLSLNSQFLTLEEHIKGFFKRMSGLRRLFMDFAKVNVPIAFCCAAFWSAELYFGGGIGWAKETLQRGEVYEEDHWGHY